MIATAATLLAGCSAIEHVLGLSHPLSDDGPRLAPGGATRTGLPVLVATLRDTLLQVGDTSTVMGQIFLAPIDHLSVPIATFADTSVRITTHDSSLVAINGARITATAPGHAGLIVQGYYGSYLVGYNLFITVVPRSH